LIINPEVSIGTAPWHLPQLPYGQFFPGRDSVLPVDRWRRLMPQWLTRWEIAALCSSKVAGLKSEWRPDQTGIRSDLGKMNTPKGSSVQSAEIAWNIFRNEADVHLPKVRLHLGQTYPLADRAPIRAPSTHVEAIELSGLCRQQLPMSRAKSRRREPWNVNAAGSYSGAYQPIFKSRQ
jgi:hypothetical protein